MFCTKCGAEVGEDSRFCVKCGAQLAAGPAAQPQAYQPYQNYQAYQPQPYQPQPYQSYYQAQFNPGSKMLRVASILFIIAGGLSILIETAMIASYDIIFNVPGVIGLVIACLAPVTIGIIGLRKYSDPSAGLFFIISGAVMLPLMIICAFIMSEGMYAPGYVITNFPGLASIVLPILFIVGGVKLRSHAKIVVYPPRPDSF